MVLRLISFLVSLLALSPSQQAQTCLPEGLFVRTQMEIDMFPANFPGCIEIAGGMTIESTSDNPISDLKGLSQISLLGEHLEIRNNPALSSLTGLENVKEIGGRLTIAGNDRLLSLDGLSGLTSVGNSVGISSNNKLKNIEVLSQLKIIRGDLSISGNTQLNSLEGLNKVVEIEGNVLIRDNASILNFNGLQSLKSVGGNFLIQENSSLRDFSGLEKLENISLDLIIEKNDKLISLTGFSGLAMVGKYLLIVNNLLLQDITALNSLKAIDGLLQVYNNPLLPSLRGLDNIDPQSVDNLAIIQCPSLSDCAVQSICDFLKINDQKHSITGNKFGCATRLQILNECEREGANTNPGPNIIRIFPNPTPGILTTKGFDSVAEFLVSDVTGRTIRANKLENGKIDISDLPAGIYLIELISEKRNFIQSIIKI
ncbi:MAG: T9SS type A sorting domain-containing protein [Saprospiraceae bacterium]|nr:T9SS type A sorting domain-containing protein [Saprospiraceae bacterium]